MKALEKDRTRRYETASGFARDIGRFLAGDPVEAGPPSATYRLRKLARKHRSGAGDDDGLRGTLAAGRRDQHLPWRFRPPAPRPRRAGRPRRPKPSETEPSRPNRPRGPRKPRPRSLRSRRGSPSPRPRLCWSFSKPRYSRRRGPRTRKGAWASGRRSAGRSTRPRRGSRNPLPASLPWRRRSTTRWGRATCTWATRHWRSATTNRR